MDIGDIEGLNVEADFSTGIIGIGGLPDELIIDVKEEIGTLSIDPQGVIGIQVMDINNDGMPDLLLAGNDFSSEVETGRNDAGIGLVLSRQIAEAHGGTLTLENKRTGSGCEARLRLPI